MTTDSTPSIQTENLGQDYEIIADKLPGLRQLFAKLARRAEKLGCRAPSLVEDERFEKKFSGTSEDGKRHEFYVDVVRCRVVGAVVSLSGWSFVAAIDHDGEENVIRSANGDSVPTKYRTALPSCDHCKTARRRAETFVLRSGDKYVQVGRNCLRDFLGHSDPSGAAAMAELLWEAVAACGGDADEGWLMGRGYPSIERYMEWVAAACRIRGFVSRKKADEEMGCVATADTAASWMGGFRPPTRTAEEEQADRVRAAEALAWARGLEGDLDDYLHNLRAASKRYSVKPKAMGLVASIVPAYERTLQKRAEAAKNVPAPEGKMVVRGTVISCKASDGAWGTTYKMTVKVEADGGQWLAWGTCPDSLLEHGRNVKPGFACDALRGCEVEFNATLSRGHEEHFAMFKRPTKARVLRDPNVVESKAA